MGATPKHRKSNRLRGARWAHIRQRLQKVQLVKLDNGKHVPMHTVTPENPIKNGVRFLASKQK